MEHLAEFLDVLEPPLQIAKPNKYKIIQLDIPIVKYTDPRSGEVLEEAVFCADILDIITQDFFARKSQSSLMDEQTQHVEEVKVRLISAWHTALWCFALYADIGSPTYYYYY